MLNPFSFISFFAKWVEGTRFDIVKLVSALIVSRVCIWVIISWNKVPHYEDSFVIETYKDNSVCQDSLFAGITIQRPYNTFNTLKIKKATAYWKVNFSGYYDRDSTQFVEKNAKTGVLFNTLADTVHNFNADSVAILFHVNGKLQLENDIARKNNNVKVMGGPVPSVERDSTLTDSLGCCIASADIVSALYPSKLDDKVRPIFLFSPVVENHIDIVHSITHLFSEDGDISQYRYSLKLKTNSCVNNINFLKIDFGGPTRFTAIYPKPDRESVSGIVYTDKTKISEINTSGLYMYCQLLESSGLQTVRMYLISTIATFFLGVAIKLLLEILWRMLKQKCIKS